MLVLIDGDGQPVDLYVNESLLHDLDSALTIVTVKSLYDATLDLELMEQVKEKHPHLLEAPG